MNEADKQVADGHQVNADAQARILAVEKKNAELDAKLKELSREIELIKSREKYGH